VLPFGLSPLPLIMGVLNITPDSFSDGGKYMQIEAALDQARRLIKEGAAIIDVGGESTRPAAEEVTVQQELDRVIPLIEKIAKETSIIISIDTSKPQVMYEAISAGAKMINDVRSLQTENALAISASLQLPVCIMHMQGQPKTMQLQPSYNNIVTDIYNFFQQRIEQCIAAGIKKKDIIIDPGFGFGKTVEHNLTLLRRLDYFKQLACPILAGLSRKSMIKQLLNLPVDKRLNASLALATIATMNGADIIRTHDVAETREACQIAAYVRDF